MSVRPLAALAALLLLTAACGEDDDGPGGGAGTTVTTGGSGGTGTGSGTGGNGGGTATGTGTAGGTGGSGTGTATGSGTGGGTSAGFACQYPGDVGIQSHGTVVWYEGFEEGSVSAVIARYDAHSSESEMALVSDTPSGSPGAVSMRMTAGDTAADTDLYKNFGTGWDDLYVRYYTKYEANVNYHHTGVWVGGYYPAQTWPSPYAGTRPNGNDRFSVAVEIMTDGTNPSPRLDFYNYWMGMQTNPGGGFWGNVLINDANLVATFDWQCIEVHIRMNTSTSSNAGAELGIWRDGESIVQYDDQGPTGRWLHDKFCRTDPNEPATATSCTDYTLSPPDVVLDLQWRTTNDLKNNYFWPQNYITSGPAGDVWYDDMVLATERIGCICPN
ncbi:MAG: hypothetical protein JRI23_11940 [Deltaproteobacteria bacterium]|jgi:hypothetical protein|nr:hypothetical protein [Deltaproteobacteria bacterium]MBW2532419.1 hypothetical protein [Deltaproteobacteria bacterium]